MINREFDLSLIIVYSPIIGVFLRVNTSKLSVQCILILEEINSDQKRREYSKLMLENK